MRSGDGLLARRSIDARPTLDRRARPGAWKGFPISNAHQIRLHFEFALKIVSPTPPSLQDWTGNELIDMARRVNDYGANLMPLPNAEASSVKMVARSRCRSVVTMRRS